MNHGGDLHECLISPGGWKGSLINQNQMMEAACMFGWWCNSSRLEAVSSGMLCNHSLKVWSVPPRALLGSAPSATGLSSSFK